MKQAYIDTVRLLIEIAPTIFRSSAFAMKGGTAINLFLQDMPRLSVDIDLVFLDHTLARDKALQAISGDLRAAATHLERQGLSIILPRNPKGEEFKLLVRSETAEIKVEVNHVFRGTLLPPQPTALSEAAENLFTSELTLPLLDRVEIYGSKLVAAMDRQHPRDIFDVMKMQGDLPLSATLLDCFVAHLAGHNRPVHEVLFSTDAPFETLYQNHFRGMTADEVSLDALLQARSHLKAALPKALTEDHKAFLLSLVKAEPDWDLMPFPHLRALPALQWKLANLEKLRASNGARFREQHDVLADLFGSTGAA